MRLAGRVFAGLTLAGATLLLSSAASAQGRVGVVTNLEGTVMVARLTEPEAQPLRFKDDVYLHDRITTGEQSVVRVLLGGKATVTARERSVLTITEVPGVATVELGEGRISVAVSKAMMKRGEIIEIKTPNAVTAIRGTVVVAEVAPGISIRSTITVLRGLIDVTRLDRGHRVGRAVNVGARQSITVLGSKLSSPRGIGADEARRLVSDFRIISSSGLSAAPPPALSQAVREATQEAEAVTAAFESRRNGSSGSQDARGHRNSNHSGSSRDENSNSGNGGNSNNGNSGNGSGSNNSGHGSGGSGHGGSAKPDLKAGISAGSGSSSGSGSGGQAGVTLGVTTASGSTGLSVSVGGGGSSSGSSGSGSGSNGRSGSNSGRH